MRSALCLRLLSFAFFGGGGKDVGRKCEEERSAYESFCDSIFGRVCALSMSRLVAQSAAVLYFFCLVAI